MGAYTLVEKRERSGRQRKNYRKGHFLYMGN